MDLSAECSDCGTDLTPWEEAVNFCKVCRRHSCQADHHICLGPVKNEHKFGAVNYEQVLGGGYRMIRSSLVYRK